MTRRAVVDGRPAPQGALARLRRRGQRLMVSRSEHEEAVVDRRLLGHPGVTRANTIAVMSPKGGVGKTTCAFLIANLLTTHLKLRTIAVDANPGFGTLAHLAPNHTGARHGLSDLLADADRLLTAAELGRYVSRLPTGLHVLTASKDPALEADRYGETVALLSCFYDVVLLDLRTGLVGPLARFAERCADQLVLVTAPDRVAALASLDALALLRYRERTTVAINAPDPGRPSAVEECFVAEGLHTVVTVPHDAQLAGMLASGTYTLGALRPPTRTAIKRLGLAVADQLV